MTTLQKKAIEHLSDLEELGYTLFRSIEGDGDGGNKLEFHALNPSRHAAWVKLAKWHLSELTRVEAAHREELKLAIGRIEFLEGELETMIRQSKEADSLIEQHFDAATKAQIKLRAANEESERMREALVSVQKYHLRSVRNPEHWADMADAVDKALNPPPAAVAK